MNQQHFKLNRTKQCVNCPWKVTADPYKIPNGYSVDKHKNLSCTIAQDAGLKPTSRVMACHHSKEGKEEYCIGYLHNQLGVGNNIPLRIKMMYCDNINDIKIVGDQHDKFEDTLPKD